MAAARPVVQAREPPIFEGRPQDDVVEWLHDFGEIAEFNQWTPAQKLRQVKWALKGYAKNWYRTRDPEPVDFDEFADAIRIAFKHPAYESGMAAQLDSRKQGLDESPVIYCFEKLALCKKVDPNMAEGAKLQHLIRGMKPTLLERVYPLINFGAPNTAAFIQQVQLFDQATWIANSNGWKPDVEPSIAQFALHLTPGTSVGPSTQFVTREQLEKRLISLENNLKAEFKEGVVSLKKEIKEDVVSLFAMFSEKIDRGHQALLESVRKELNENYQSLGDN